MNRDGLSMPFGHAGLGGPGRHHHQITYFGLPRSKGLSGTFFWNPDLADRLRTPSLTTINAWQKQLIPKTYIHNAIEANEPMTFYGSGAIEVDTKDQFKKYVYPIPKKEGGTETMIRSDTRAAQLLNRQATELALRNRR
jgi:trimethylamine-N-oxide reductase (cytochrome c)